MANAAKDVAIPIQAESKSNPLPDSDEVVQQGRQIYADSCALCHAADGHGRTDLGQNMYPPAMDMTSPHVQHWTDAELFWIIQNGVRLTGMPAWKASISEDNTWKLARFIHHLPQLNAAQPAAPPAGGRAEAAGDPIRYGQVLYRQEGCFMCHQLHGEGTKVGPDLTLEGTRGRNSDWLIGHFKNPQAYSPGTVMPGFQNLTDSQLQALTRFLQSQKGECQ
jgi:mono/diheme cytochrome c family protein